MKRHLSFLVLPLALAGCDAMTAHTGVVARVEQQELTVDETVELLQANPRIPPQTEVVGTVANLWVDYMMLAKLLARDTALADIDLAALVEPYIEQRTFMQLREQVLTSDTVISDEELQASFQEQAPGQRVRARHVLLTYPEGADEATRDSVRTLADEIRQQAAAGDDFAALARQHSQDPGTAGEGGDLGWFERGRMVAPFEEAAFALETGEVSGVVETPFGLHVIKVEERENPTWDPARGDEFRRRMVTQRLQESLTEYVDQLREPMNIEVHSGAADVARDLAQDPGQRLSGRAASRKLVSWEGGALTTREFVAVLRRLSPPQQNQYATLQEEQIENVLRELATNELVLGDARERGITVPQEEQDSIRELIREELVSMARDAGLVGPAQEGESDAQAVERRVRSLLQGVLTGQGNLMPLGALPYVMRDRFEWEIYESSFPEAVEQLQERRQGQQGVPPMPPGGAMPQGAPGAGQGAPGAGQGAVPPRTPPDTTG